jgi:transcriptional regulator with XRE-family HTH domain
MMMLDNKKVQARREELGFSDVEVAARAGISIHQYSDIERHADEFRTVLTLREARQVCEILELDLLEFLGLDEFINGGEVSEALPKHELIKRRREQLGLRIEDIAEHLGFDESTRSEVLGELAY